MPAALIDGLALAKSHRERIAARAAAIKAKGDPVRLDAVLVESGDNAARMYADNQAKTCQSLGIDYRLHLLKPDASYDDIAGRILLLNTNDDVHAVMLHLPLPEGVDPYSIQRLIDPDKDVEGVNPANIGNVVYGRSSHAPCTALAVIKMIESVLAPGVQSPSSRLGAGATPPLLRGKIAVVVGAGDVVGKPIAVLLMRHEATVVSCNKYSPFLPTITRTADVLVAAAGVPGLITAEMVKPGAIVIDVGVNRVTDSAGKTRTVGDVAFDLVRDISSHISPVPGGVGPMTVAMLLLNVVDAAEHAR